MQSLEQGGGYITQINETEYDLVRPVSPTNVYANAQIDTYRHGGLSYKAPLRLTLSARFSHPSESLKGTVGFGFWNAPFEPGKFRLRVPRAAWFFFGSPPHNMPFAMNVAGHGFKAATIDASTALFFALLPTAPIGFLLMRVPHLYRRFWPIAQRALKVSERSLDHLDLTQRHDYRLDWLPDRVEFWVDGQKVHHSPYSPRKAMGFVAWLDNQYMVVTPQGRFAWGIQPCDDEQSLHIENLHITHL